MSRDRLIGLLWPESETAQARKLLSEAIYQIRKEFGDDVLDTAGDEVAIPPGRFISDLATLRAAIATGEPAAVVAAYTGHLLDGWFPDDAPELEQLIEAERTDLRRAFERAIEATASTAEQEGRWHSAAEWWRSAIAQDPYRARYALAAANALERAGEPAEALSVLTTHARRHLEELGLEPDDEIDLTIERLRRPRRPSPVGTTDARPPSLSPVVALPPTETIRRRDPRARRPQRRLLLVVGALVLTVGTVAWFGRGDVAPRAEEQPHRLAIMYLEDRSPEQQLGPIADLLTESIIEQLAGVNAFEVVPMSGVKQFRDGTTPRDSVIEVLGATHVIEGSLQREGERLIGFVRLIEAATGVVVATNSFERDRAHLVELRSAVAEEVSAMIRQRLGQEVRLRSASVGSSNARAWVLVSRGARDRDDARSLVTSFGAEARASARRALRRADSLFQQAAAEDPAWFRPHVERGQAALALALTYQGAERAAILDSALARLVTAQSRHGREPEILEALGQLRWARAKTGPPPADASYGARALADLESAVAVDSMRARAWATISNIHWVGGDPARSEVTARRALAVDAYLEEAPQILRSLVSASILLDRVDSADAWCARGRRAYPRDWQFTECSLTVMKYAARRPPDPARAWALVARLDSLDPPDLAHAAGHGYAPIYRRVVAAAVSARAGDIGRAREELERARSRAEGEHDLVLDLIPDEITLLLIFGDTVTARDRLAFAVARRPILAGVAARDPILRTLLSAPAPR